jgi:lipopolysaccharide transport system permease protein
VAGTSHNRGGFRALIRHRHLCWELVRRDLTDRHAGQILGPAWMFAQPLVLIALHLFLFAVVLPARGLGGSNDLSYVVSVLAGLIPWLAIQDSLLRGVASVATNANLVKQVVFPVELLPIKGVFVALVPPAAMTGLLLLYLVGTGYPVPWTIVLLPAVWLVQVAGTLGLCLGFAAVGTYVRDVRESIHLFGLVNLYLMPVFFQPAVLPAAVRFVPYANPFSHVIWCHQDVWSGRLSHPTSWIVFPIAAGLALLVGWRIFRAARPHFGNVL